ATPAAHSNFSGWSGACSGSDSTCQVTMDQARDVTATFTVFQPDLTIVKSHSGDFTQGGSGSYTVTVSNDGTDPSYGDVSVTDSRSEERRVGNVRRAGWGCDDRKATCTRTDALA